MMALRYLAIYLFHFIFILPQYILEKVLRYLHLHARAGGFSAVEFEVLSGEQYMASARIIKSY